MSDFKELTGGMDDLSRRAFMTMTAQRMLAVGLAPFAMSGLASAMPTPRPDESALAAAGGRARNVIYLYMSGGMSHIDTFDPKPGTPQAGPTKAIATNVDGVRLTEHLPKLAQHMDKVALIRSMNTATGAHYPGNYLMHTGYQERGTIRHPQLGAWILELSGKGNQTLPGNVQIGGGSRQTGNGFLDASHAPLRIGKPEQGLTNIRRGKRVSETAFDRRLDLAARADAAFRERYDVKEVRAYTSAYEEAVRLMNSEDLEAFDLEREDAKLRAAYGDDSFGQGCLLARRLVERDVRFVEVTLGGWDHHTDIFDRLPERAAILDQALAALLADLSSRGLLETTLVVLATEFGRKPDLEAYGNGRGHFPTAFSCLLAGGGVRGGQVHGRTDERAGAILEKPVSVQDFSATMAHALGLPQDQVVHSPSGRPFTVADKGKPVVELF